MDKHEYRPYPKRIYGQYNFHRKLSFEEIRIIRAKIEMGAKLAKIAKEYSVSRTTIHCISVGKTYKGA